MHYQEKPENLNPYHTPETDFGEIYEEYDYDTTPFYKATGRIGRLRYLAYSVALSFVLIVPIGILSAILLPSFNDSSGVAMIILGTLVAIAGAYINIAPAKRRFNDLNRSGWWAILLLIPYLNIIPWLYLVFARGNDGVNDYGAPAMPPSTRVKFLALLVPIFALLGILAAIAIPAYQEYVIRAQMAQIGSL